MMREDILSPLSEAVESVLGTLPAALSPLKAETLEHAGGNRRALLVALLGRFFAVDREETMKTAAAVETVHLATLVHDDIIDGARSRRGGPALARSRGLGCALLLGDLLFIKGIAAVNSLRRRTLTARILETGAAICAGELLEDESRPEFPPGAHRCLRIARLKTASLFVFAAAAPGILGGRDRRTIAALECLGLNLGLAYQIADDCLDLAPPGFHLGKDRLADLRNGTSNLALALAAGEPRLRKRIAEARGGARARLEKIGEAVRSGGAVSRAADWGLRFIARAGTAADRIGLRRRRSGFEEYLEDSARRLRTCGSWS
ncbi:MAG TPA: polyprenyl synthetase family protein [bacterium]|nr:polyprenyl synthetase family protein [bacterium]HPQ65231.1 polyprenyl synthetase family protein [bacterium]